MRRFCLFLLLASLTLAEEHPTAAPQLESPANLSIPVQLSRTVSTDKCKVGDSVEFKSLEPVLIGKGVVMPTDTRLHGRVLGTASRQGDKPAWLVLLVDRAEWKEYSLPLHAFIASQITVKPKASHSGAAAAPLSADNGTPQATTNRRPRNLNARQAGMSDPAGDLSSVAPRAPQDGTAAVQDELPPDYKPLDDVHIFRDKNGTTFLLSQKANVKLPSGTMLMLRNQPVVKPVAGTEAKPTSTAATQ